MSESTQCCICLSDEHSCNDEETCRCVPLLHFCPVCVALKDNEDKRICVNCLQRMISELPSQNAEERAQRVSLTGNTLEDFRVELLSLTTEKILFASKLLKQSYLHTKERTVIKGCLFAMYCPASFLSIVATDNQNVAHQGLLIRALMAQRYFPSSCNTTLLKHCGKTFRFYQNFPINRVAMLQRPHLRDSSCITVERFDEEFANFISGKIKTARFQPLISADAGNRMVHNTFEQYHDVEPQDLEEISDLLFDGAQSEQSVNNNGALLERTHRQILCPMCRQHCKVQKYVQSATERQELQRLSDVSDLKTNNDNKCINWDVRHAQRKSAMIFDSENINQQCECCMLANRDLMRSDAKDSYKKYKAESAYVLALISIAFLLIDRPLLMTFVFFIVTLAKAALNYRKCTRQTFDGQIFSHCLIRNAEALDEVLTASCSPGLFAHFYGNESFYTDISLNIRQSNQEMDNPIALLIDLEHQTWLGGVCDRLIQFLYLKDCLLERWTLAGQLLYSPTRMFAQTSLAMLVTYRLTNCNFLLQRLANVLSVLKNLSDECRFRLQMAKSFATSMIYLKKDIVEGEEDSSTWQCKNAEDRQRLTAEIEGSKKILFERVPNQNAKLYNDEKLHRAQEIAQNENKEKSLFSRLKHYLQVCYSSFKTLTPGISMSSIFFAGYPTHTAGDYLGIRHMITIILGSCGKSLFDRAMLNAFIVKILCCAIYSWTQSEEQLPFKFALTFLTYMRFELVLLFIRVLIPMWFEEVWMSSNLSNAKNVTEMCNFFSNNYFLKHLLKQNSVGGAVSIDSIRVGKNIATQ